jgi:hypothetical protein
MPIIAIAFYMVIIRIGMAKTVVAFAEATLAGQGIINQRSGNGAQIPLEVHITQLAEHDKSRSQTYSKSRDIPYDPMMAHGRASLAEDSDPEMARGTQAV